MNDTQAPVMYTENDVVAPLYKNQPVATLAVLADYLWTSKKTLQGNIQKNPSRFIEGKHYFNVSHEDLKSTSSILLKAFDYKGKNGIQVWTERGCARLSKLLRTDAAWDLWELMEESYFSKEQLPKLPQNFAQALRQLADTTEEKEKALETIKKKDELLIVTNNSSIQVGEVKVGEFVKGASGIHIGANTFYKWMRKEGYVFKDLTQPIQEYVNRGWFTYKPTRGNNGRYYNTLLITPKGKLLLEEAYISSLKENNPSTNFNLN